MRIDLHTHSRASDGTQTPAQLMRAAAEAGLDVVALTDHDTTDGWAEAEESARAVGITLVKGIEISCWHQGLGVHLLAYLPDPTYPPLVEHLRKVLDGRSARVPAILDRLRDLDVDIDIGDVRRAASGTAAPGRPHVADALVAIGVVADRAEAFHRYLKPGRPAYVDRYAAPLIEIMSVVADAGGVTVIAHPWGRHGQDRPDGATLDALAGLGLAGIEVDHQDHDARARERLRAIARDLSLVVTGSSDHHGLGKDDHGLGCNTTDPAEFERLLELAAAAAARSACTPPLVVAG